MNNDDKTNSGNTPNTNILIKYIFSVGYVGLLTFLIVSYYDSTKTKNSITSNAQEQSVTPQVETSTQDTTPLEVDNKLKALGKKIHIDDLDFNLGSFNSKLQHKGLAHLPSVGFKDGLAGVVRKYHLHIQKPDATCLRSVTSAGGLPGCYVSFFVSRKRATGHYGELAGFMAEWFMGLDDNQFRPIGDGWSDILSNTNTEQARAYLAPGGVIDTDDRE